MSTSPSPDLDQYLAAGAEHLRERRAEEARAAFAQATRIAPGSAAAWRGLGNSLHALGKEEEGGAAHLRALQASVGDPELARAGKAVAANRLTEAYPPLRDRLQAEPNDIAALRIMADLAARMGRYIDAARMLVRAIDLAPGFDIARGLLHEMLYRAPRDEALAEVEQQLSRKPDHLGFLNLKGSLLDRAGDYEGAVAVHRRMLEIRPGDPSTWVRLGHALETLGRTGESIDAQLQAIALDPATGEAWWSLANLKTFRFRPDQVEALHALVARDDLDQDNRLHIEFALGKALEDAGDHAASFAHYAEGNRLRRGMTAYDPEHFADWRRRAIRFFTPEFFAARAGAGAPAPDPIFVVGMPRSGSTLVEQILASHPQVEGTMELDDMPRIVRGLDAPGGRYPESLAPLPPDRLAALGQEYLRATRAQRKTDRPRFIDKLPVNFLYVGLIRTILPNARIIDVRRHPLSCGWSCFRQHFARGFDFAFDLVEIGGYYRGYVEMMEHWDRVLPGHVHRIFYEDLVADTEGEIRRLLDYAGLPFDEACLRFHETKRAVRTPSAEQVRQPIFTQGLDHWRNYEPWLGPLKDALGDVLTRYPARARQ